MRTKNQIESLRPADSAVAKEQPPGVKLLRTLCEYTGVIRDIAWSLDGRMLASSSDDGMIILWNAETGECLHTLKGGKGYSGRVAFDPAGRVLASCGGEKTVRLWEVANGALVRTLKGHSQDVAGVSWSKDGGWLASCSMDVDAWPAVLAVDSALRTMTRRRTMRSRLVGSCRADDYRLIHALFLDDADLALVLFDPTRHDDPLGGVEFWLKQLKVGARQVAGIPIVLIAARSDRGTPRLTHEELEAFCRQRGIKAYLSTSAKAGEGIEELTRHMQGLIPWDDKPATVTTETFKRMKDFILDLKRERSPTEGYLDAGGT